MPGATVGWFAIPLCWLRPAGACESGRGHDEREVGKALVREFLAIAGPPLEMVLARIVAARVVTREGTIHDRACGDPVLRRFCAPPPGFSVPSVTERPTAREIAEEREALIEVLQDFPLVKRHANRVEKSASPERAVARG